MEDNNNKNTIYSDNQQVKEEKPQIKSISGLYKNWFLDYASYVILERAVPHLTDGLKPVQRRILHAMKRLDDGRYNKVANIIGYTMQYHPHGDASIGDALVQLGQKNLLIDMQGNWGNILTGDNAAAPRYIEARLSKFALDVIFNPKTTYWKQSYDGRNKEPINLPVKFPLLLTQGVEGIAVGLASKILPHNFNELIDCSILHLQGKSFEIFPDFLTGGMTDVSKYNDGLRGGKIRVRARLTKTDKKTIAITEVPFGKTTGSLIDSIISANDKGKIKIKRIDDNTAENVEIIVELATGISPDQTIDALYAFTDCEISISPNACIISNERPEFIGVSQILRNSADNTMVLLRRELEIRRDELNEDWHFSSLEKIFIENRIYLSIEDCETYESIIETINKELLPYKPDLRREVTREDIIRLTEIRIKRISKYDAFKAEKHLLNIEEELKKVEFHLANIVEYSINYFKNIKEKYGKTFPRCTEIRSFDVIEATRVVVNNEKMYINRTDGFIGTSLKKDEFLFDCSDIDDIIVFRRNGTYMVTKVSSKSFVGQHILHIAVWLKNDDRTIYNSVYLDGKSGYAYAKRFAVKAITRDKEYNLTQGKPNSRSLYFSANTNGEAETLKVTLKPRQRLRKLFFEFSFSSLSIKGRSANGNIMTRNAIHRVVLKEKGESTLGGRKIWFDHTVLKFNDEERGTYIDEFHSGERIIVITKKGEYCLYPIDLSIRFEEDIARVEKFDAHKIYSVVFYDAGQKYYYLKRFIAEETEKPLGIIGANKDSTMNLVLDEKMPRIKVVFGGRDKNRPAEIIDVSEFIAVKGYKARGKRLTTYNVNAINRLDPIVTESEIAKFEDEKKKQQGVLFEVSRPESEKTLFD